MPFNDKQKKQFIAVARQLKQQKGLTFKQSELQQDIINCKKAQEEILKLKEGFENNKEVTTKVEENHKKLQTIIDDLNEYMRILHPEGLLDFGKGSAGQALMGNG